jgi:hypothetical protein
MLLVLLDQVLPLRYMNEIKARTLSQVRGTVQADKKKITKYLYFLY